MGTEYAVFAATLEEFEALQNAELVSEMRVDPFTQRSGATARGTKSFADMGPSLYLGKAREQPLATIVEATISAVEVPCADGLRELCPLSDEVELELQRWLERQTRVDAGAKRFVKAAQGRRLFIVCDPPFVAEEEQNEKRAPIDPTPAGVELAACLVGAAGDSPSFDFKLFTEEHGPGPLDLRDEAVAYRLVSLLASSGSDARRGDEIRRGAQRRGFEIWLEDCAAFSVFQGSEGTPSDEVEYFVLTELQGVRPGASDWEGRSVADPARYAAWLRRCLELWPLSYGLVREAVRSKVDPALSMERLEFLRARSGKRILQKAWKDARKKSASDPHGAHGAWEHLFECLELLNPGQLSAAVREASETVDQRYAHNLELVADAFASIGDTASALDWYGKGVARLTSLAELQAGTKAGAARLEEARLLEAKMARLRLA